MMDVTSALLLFLTIFLGAALGITITGFFYRNKIKDSVDKVTAEVSPQYTTQTERTIMIFCLIDSVGAGNGSKSEENFKGN
jgi:hypothetical protein